MTNKTKNHVSESVAVAVMFILTLPWIVDVWVSVLYDDLRNRENPDIDVIYEQW